MKNYVVYLIKNTLNGKYYVGYTKDFDARWEGHCICARYGEKWHLSCAIRKYGVENFEHELLRTNLSQGEAKQLEKLWVVTLRSYDPEVGYNMTYGGDGWKGWELLSDNEKERILRKRSASLRERMKNPTQKMIERGEKIATTLRTRGIKPPGKARGITDVEYYGVEKAKEISRKLSEINLGTKKGVWITDGTRNQVVPECYIPEGWKRGRTQKQYERNAPVLYSTILKRSASIKLTWERKRKTKELELNLLPPVTGDSNSIETNITGGEKCPF